MKLYDIVANLKFVGIKNYKDAEIDSLTCNSNEKTENSIYFCINGTKVDGHNFAKQAVHNGAVCLVVERFVDVPITQILVEDVRVAMSHIASIFYETYKSKMKFVGITGTNGKTTTTFLIREILMKMGHSVGLIGTEGQFINNLMLPGGLTTPDPIDLHKLIKDMEQNACEYCVMEVSAHAIALNKIDDIMYDVVGFSNLTEDHLDFFLNMDNYLKCKASLFNATHAKLGVVNMYGAQSKYIANNSKISTFKIGDDLDLSVFDIKINISGSTFKMKYNGKEFECKTNLIGNYNVENVSLAVSVLLNLGFEMEKILSVIKETNFVVPGRMNLLDIKENFDVVVDFAHTPDGMQNVLKTIQTYTQNKLITVFGCGGNRDKAKRKIMGEVASDLSDIVVLTSDNPRDENPEVIMDQAEENIDKRKLKRIENRKQAIEYALSIAGEGDVVAILGKGNENYQEIKGVKFPFSDYQVVDEYLQEKHKEGETAL